MNENAAFVKVYHRSGLQVTIPLPVGGGLVLSTDDAAALAVSVDNLLAAGWLADAPGLEAGETKEQIGWVCRRAKVNDDGSETPMIDLYVDNEKMTFKILTVYLNTADEVHTFEAVSGVQVDKLPLFEGDNAPERGTPKAAKYTVRTPRPFGVIHEPNPAYDPEKKKPKRRFVRWADAPTPTPTPPPNVSSFPGTPAAKPPSAPGAAVERKPMSEEQRAEFTRRAIGFGLERPEIAIALQAVVDYTITTGADWLEGYENALAACIAWKAKYDMRNVTEVAPNVAKGTPLMKAINRYVVEKQTKEAV